MDSLEDLSVREGLRQHAIALLEADPRVRHVTPGGSLHQGSADRYSDIDLRVELLPAVNNRAFAEQVSTLLDPLGPRLVDGWGVRMLPGKYVRTLYLERYPLFWHLDLGVVGGTHTDGTDLLGAPNAARFLKTWLETLKGVLRGKVDTDPDYIETMLGRWLALLPSENDAPVQRLTGYLERCWEQTRTEALATGESLPPLAQFYTRCRALAVEYTPCTH